MLFPGGTDQLGDEERNSKQCMSHALFRKTDEAKNAENPSRGPQRRDNEEQTIQKRCLSHTSVTVDAGIHSMLYKLFCCYNRKGEVEKEIPKTKQARNPKASTFTRTAQRHHDKGLS